MIKLNNHTKTSIAVTIFVGIVLSLTVFVISLIVNSANTKSFCEDNNLIPVKTLKSDYVCIDKKYLVIPEN